MTTPISGVIGLLDIQNEFAGVNPIGINEYYAGGAYVPSGTSGIPSSGQIAINNFYNKSKQNWGSVTPNTTTVGEGGTVTFTYIPGVGIPDGTYYYRIDLISNLDSADFSTALQGSFTVSGGVGTIAITIATDTTIDGAGTFRLLVGNASGVSVVYVTSATVSVSDTYSVWINTPSRSTVYRYANLNTAYTNSTYTIGSSGLAGTTLAWALETSSGSTAPTTADLVSISGYVTIPADGSAGIVNITAKTWAGEYIASDKTFTLVLTLPNGSNVRTTSGVTVIASPVFSTGASPTTVREGQTSTIYLGTTNVPLGASAAQLYFTMSGTASPTTDWYGGVSQGVTDLNLAYQVADIIMASDTLSEGTETLTFNWRINNYSGTVVASVTINIQNQGVINAASLNYNSAQISSISSYPASRDFSLTYTAAGSTSGSAGTLTVPANSISSNSLVPISSSSGNNPGSHSMVYTITGSGYDTYTVSKSETFTFPVYSFSWYFSGTNASGSVRTLYASIGSTLPYGTSRSFVLEYKLKAAGAATWPATWSTGFLNPVVVAANATSSPEAYLRPATAATTQYDVVLRCVLAGQQIQETTQYGVWI